MNRLLLIMFSFLFCFGVKGQVAVGSGETPADYAILQIDGTDGGLRLPRISSQEREKLTEGLLAKNDTEAHGLIIYNTEKNEIQFWNGDNWISMLTIKELNDSKNGITGSNHFKLGGQLTELTTITQPDNNLLYFDVTTGTVTVGGNMFTVNQTGVAIGNTPSNAVFDVKVPEKGGMKIKTPELKDITITTNPSGEKDLKNTYVLTSDNSGNVRWETMLAVPTSLQGTWASNVGSLNINGLSSGGGVKELATINLTKGTWLITARYVALSSGTSSLPALRGTRADPDTWTFNGTYSYGYLAWIMFGKSGLNPTPDSSQLVSSIGLLPSCAASVHAPTSGANYVGTTNNTGQLSAAPYMTCIVEITSDTEGTYALYGNLNDSRAGSISVINTDQSQPAGSNAGYSYLTGIKLSAN